ncbi:MAG: GNAT family N-acetyltransferase [Pseudomonadota bacterium]
MKYNLYRPDELSAEQWQIYAALRDARDIYDNPFFDPDFAKLVGEVREDTRIGFASDDAGVFAVWPMHIRPGNWARPIGSPFSDWNGPILAANVELSPQEILAGFDISGFTTNGFLPQSRATSATLKRSGANLSDLSGGCEAFLEDQKAQWPKHFKKMRRIYRNIERDFSEMRYEWDDRSDEAYAQLIELKQAQYQRTGFFDVLKAEWVRDLFDRLRTFEGPRLRARLISIYFDDVQAASEFNLQSDKILHGWITAFDQDYKSYSPGHVLLQETLGCMCQHGLRMYDSGPGLDKYKRNYSNMQTLIESGVISGAPVQLSPERVAGRAWSLGEHVMPAQARRLMARARRRMDQIASVETSMTGRASGVLSALQNRPN